MNIPPLLQQLLTTFVILTSTGTLVQDARFGRVLEVAAPLSNISLDISSHLEGMNEAASAHSVHAEREALQHDFASTSRIQARDDHRRYYTPKNLSHRNSLSGDSAILWPSV